jgi:hypothetical protein
MGVLFDSAAVRIDDKEFGDIFGSLSIKVVTHKTATPRVHLMSRFDDGTWAAVCKAPVAFRSSSDKLTLRFPSEITCDQCWRRIRKDVGAVCKQHAFDMNYESLSVMSDLLLESGDETAISSRRMVLVLMNGPRLRGNR